MSGYLKLPLTFDVARMRAELAALPEEAWVRHFNTGEYEGGWRCAALRSVGGEAGHILPLEGGQYADTAWLDQCPYLREVLARFECETTSVRLMALEPGARIHEHRDPGTSLEEGITRVHVPIETSDQARFRIDGEDVHFGAGHAWYLDASCLHAAENRGDTARVHLMLDCVTNPWLQALFREAGGLLRQPLTAHERALMRGTLERWSPGQPLQGWYPVTFEDTGGAPVIGWRHLGDKPLAAPFFEDSLNGLAPAERRACRTPLQALAAFEGTAAPSAIVFHVSRCGSTLLTQMLSSLPHGVALSEPPVLDGFLRFHHRHPGRSGGLSTLRGLVAALAQRAAGGQAHAVLKMDSWHMPWIGLLREAFPRTPFVLLYRDPREVLASHARQRGRHMVPGLVDLAALGPRLEGLAPGDLDGHAARVLDAVFEAALANAGTPGLRLVNYSQLPRVVMDELLPAWGIACTPAQREAVQARAQFHSKHPSARFEASGTAHEGTGAAALRCYTELEAQRLAA